VDKLLARQSQFSRELYRMASAVALLLFHNLDSIFAFALLPRTSSTRADERTEHAAKTSGLRSSLPAGPMSLSLSQTPRYEFTMSRAMRERESERERMKGGGRGGSFSFSHLSFLPSPSSLSPFDTRSSLRERARGVRGAGGGACCGRAAEDLGVQVTTHGGQLHGSSASFSLAR
jgi:hypothetical protein